MTSIRQKQLIPEKMKLVIPWLLTAVMSGLAGHFMDRLNAEITFSDGVLQTLHVYSETCK